MLSSWVNQKQLHGKKAKIFWDVENCRLPTNTGKDKVLTFTRVISEVEIALGSINTSVVGLSFVAIRHQNVARLVKEQHDDLQRSFSKVVPLYSDLDSAVGDKYGVADNRLKPVMTNTFEEWSAFGNVDKLCVMLFSGDGDYRDEVSKFLSKGASVVVFHPPNALGEHMESLRVGFHDRITFVEWTGFLKQLMRREDLKFSYTGGNAPVNAASSSSPAPPRPQSSKAPAQPQPPAAPAPTVASPATSGVAAALKQQKWDEAEKQMKDSGFRPKELRSLLPVAQASRALFGAVGQGRAAIVRLLLKWTDADVNAAENGRVPLFVAARDGQAQIVRALIDAKADVNIGKADNGATPLFVAVQNGFLEIVLLLIEARAHVNKSLTTDGSSPLYMASQKGNMEIVRALINAKANVNKARTSDMVTPLHLAVHLGNVNLCQLLLESGADIDRRADGALPEGMAKAAHVHQGAYELCVNFMRLVRQQVERFV